MPNSPVECSLFYFFTRSWYLLGTARRDSLLTRFIVVRRVCRVYLPLRLGWSATYGYPAPKPREKSPEELIVGVWEVVQSENSAIVEYRRNGTFARFEGPYRISRGSYMVAKDTERKGRFAIYGYTTGACFGYRERIQSLSADELVIGDEKRSEVYRRVR